MELKSTDPYAPLVARARTGDFSAFEQLVARYERRLFSTAMRIVGRRQDAEEVVQETLTSVIEHLADFREDAKFYTWLMRIAVNHALKLLRKNRRLQNTDVQEGRADSYSELPHPQFIAPWKENPAWLAEQRELQRLLAAALDELDEKYRTVFVLRDIEERSTSEVAELLNLSESNVKVRLLRARLQLRERITRALGDESRQVVPDHRHD